MLPDRLRVVYLHGFASSPSSRKARFFQEQLSQLNLPLEIPDLTKGDFQGLTISGQLRTLEDLIAGSPNRDAPLALIGSSLGGYLAALYAARHPVHLVVLLAPAFGFHQLWVRELGPERLAYWKTRGTIPIFHYGSGREMQLGYQLLEDAAEFEAFPSLLAPALIFHGTQDPVVPVQYSADYAAKHPNVRFIPVASGHELTDVLDLIWRDVKVFLLNGQSQMQC
ncbi:MAG: alpha/beta fold hydrolase [Acidobacteriaceae bacterium]|nr:alpha/beta fold hydrolase [Acidobacteriaceae bacterium]